MEAVIFSGIQAVGKSTFYKTRMFHTHVRINLDMLKTRHRERLLLQACLEGKQPFVVDNTNVTVDERQRYLDPAKSAGFTVVGYYFQSVVRDALIRNQTRTVSAVVPDIAIRGTSNRLQIPDYTEGFDTLYYVSITDDGDFTVQEWQDGE